MTPARDTLPSGIPTAGHTAFGPAVLCKSITRRTQKDWNLWKQRRSTEIYLKSG